MKPQLHKLPIIDDNSFLYTQWDCRYFDKPWHFHEEYELVLIEKSWGTKFIGDKVSYFTEGDLLLIGSNVPHLFRNNEDFYVDNGELNARSIFIHFTEDFLGKDFFHVPEMKLVFKLIQNSTYALDITGKTKIEVIKKLHDMHYEKPSKRLLSLLEILVNLSESEDLHPILSNNYVDRNQRNSNNDKDTDRIHRVFEFILENYRKEIYVGKIASMLNMSTVSFSRYFKHHTRKTFSEYLTEIRISHACSSLMQDTENISQICYSSGFENLSNFYRHFRHITGVIPKEYRKRFVKTTI
ncbi:MAG: AraC family transcriptional regulator [Ginsengibacter sp.]